MHAAFRPRLPPAAARACVSYALASAAVTLMNKVVFSHAHFHFPWFTLAFQNLISVCLISLAHLLGITSSGRLSLRLTRSMPLPILFFILFIFTNAQSLRYVNLPILTVCKSLGPMFVTLFERAYFKDRFPPPVYLSMFLIVLSAFVTAINDLEFSPVGYLWAALNVVANVAYLASLRIFLNDPAVPALDKTFHSNLLSVLPILAMALASREFPHVFHALAARSLGFKLAYLASGFLTTAVCATAFWTLSVTNGSTLSFIGGFNKVPIILFSLFLFDMHISVAGWVGVSLGVLAGIVFIKAKSFAKYKALAHDDDDVDRDTGNSTHFHKRGGPPAHIVDVVDDKRHSVRPLEIALGINTSPRGGRYTKDHATATTRAETVRRSQSDPSARSQGVPR